MTTGIRDYVRRTVQTVQQNIEYTVNCAGNERLQEAAGKVLGRCRTPELSAYMRRVLTRYAESPKKLAVLERLAKTRNFGSLTAQQAKIVVDRTLGDGPVDKLTEKRAKQYEMILDDIPFKYQSPKMKTHILRNPDVYAKKTQVHLLGKGPAALPSKEQLDKAVAEYLKDKPKGFWAKLLNPTVYYAYRQVVQNKRNYWNFFMKHWYDPARGGGTVGEHFAGFLGYDWWKRLAEAHNKFVSTTVPCTIDNFNHEMCPVPGYVDR